jgi:hypothetical protein
MAINYKKLADMSLRQINDKGRNVTLRYVDIGQYDPVNDTVSGGGDSDVTVKAVFRDYTQKELDDTIIQEDDKEVLIAAKDITKPSINDVVVDTDILKIVNVKEVRPGDTALIYKLQARK